MTDLAPEVRTTLLLQRGRPQAFRQYDVTPSQAEAVAAEAERAAGALLATGAGCLAWAVHLSFDRRRVVTIEAWQDRAAFAAAGRSGDLPHRRPDTALYAWAGTARTNPAPVTDAGVIAIDVFRVPRVLVRPVSAFNVRNGQAFAQQPGSISTAVLRGLGAGRIATYARWRTVDDFLAAFRAVGGAEVRSLDDINAAAARRTRGLIRTDYHAYELVAAQGEAAA